MAGEEERISWETKIKGWKGDSEGRVRKWGTARIDCGSDKKRRAVCIPSGQRQASGYFLWKQQLSSFATTAEHECNGTKAGKIYERPPLHAKGRHVNVSITRAACRENRALIPVLKLVTPPPF